MENSTRKYYNRVALTGAERGTVGSGQHKVLKLRFSAWDKDQKTAVSKFFTMFLNEQNNDRNRETLQILGVQNPPKIINHDAFQDGLQGLGDNVVDLVAEDNEAGYENVKYINAPKFGIRVFDMR